MGWELPALDAGMGRGEYSYIYAVAYLDRILSADENESSGPFDGAPSGNRIHGVMTQILRNQLAQLDTIVERENDPAMRQIRDEVADEIRTMEAQPKRLLWQDGLPAAVASSLELYRERLDAVFCPYTIGFEFVENRQRGLSIQGD